MKRSEEGPRAHDPRRQAGADCGFASFAGSTEIPPSVVWAKLAAQTAGARLGSRRL
jgi:5-methyltetrahydropteroyltriglutamate--homocysteine methyltransferase